MDDMQPPPPWIVVPGTTTITVAGIVISLADWIDDRHYDTICLESWWCGYAAVTRAQADALFTSDTPSYRGMPVIVGGVLPDEMSRAIRKLRRAERRVRRTGGGSRVAPHGQHRVILKVKYDNDRWRESYDDDETGTIPAFNAHR